MHYVVDPKHEALSAPESLPGFEPGETSEDLFWHVVRRVAGRILCVPMTLAEAAAELRIPQAEARKWLARLEGEGVLIRTRGKRPTFVARQTDLFAGAAPGLSGRPPGSQSSTDQIDAAFRFLATELVCEPLRPAEIAAELGITKRHAESWLRRLAKAGVLKTVRRGGG